MAPEFVRGYWKAVDDMLGLFNSFDSEGMDGRTVRARLHEKLMAMRPRDRITMFTAKPEEVTRYRTNELGLTEGN